ncbi:TrmH family RNA methyltransferase [Maribacter sp. 2210JD10-5]|uniref:TrmH family RNA methyltransferase n=1 Tax=Maribacter sp. 2210JD10-5 TaxID=3386272 RepID=UPI0039BD324E
MSITKYISSIQNPLIKKALLLKEKSRERKKSGLFIVEGNREIRLAYSAGYQFETLFYCEALLEEKEIESLSAKFKSNVPISVSKEVYQKLAYRDTTEGILAICKTKSHTLDNLALNNKNPLILVAEAPEKPGNIGALLRTADAANLDAVIIANPKTDLYNPNIIRSSIGCLFSRTVATGTTREIIEYLQEKRINTYCAALTASVSYTAIDFTGATAIVVGTEDKGLTDEWLHNATQNIIIPMEGEIDSMNVSVSAAILIFEAKRQRQK